MMPSGGSFQDPPSSAHPPVIPPPLPQPTRTMQLMRATKPWVRFMSIFGFIVAGLMVAVGVFVGVTAILGGSGFGQQLLFSLLYPVFGVLYFLPSLFLGQYASRIGDFLQSGTLESLDAALEAQKKFWRFVGIMAIVVISAYIVIFLGAIVVGLILAAR